MVAITLSARLMRLGEMELTVGACNGAGPVPLSLLQLRVITISNKLSKEITWRFLMFLPLFGRFVKAEIITYSPTGSTLFLGNPKVQKLQHIVMLLVDNKNTCMPPRFCVY